MAEFCVDCWNKINETNDSARRYVLSWGDDLCEVCGKYKRVIVAEKLWSRMQRKRFKRIGATEKNEGK